MPGIADAVRGRMPSLTIMVAMPSGVRKPAEPEPDPDPPTRKRPGKKGEEDTPEEADNQRIVAEAMQALTGKHKHPDVALSEFISTFGRDELDKLRRMVREEEPEEEPEYASAGRLIEGPGGGMADRIAARAGKQPVLLSDGEYVVPADVVSHLGDGSTKGGVRHLEAMIERVRHAKTGNKKQAKPGDIRSLLSV